MDHARPISPGHDRLEAEPDLHARWKKLGSEPAAAGSGKNVWLTFDDGPSPATTPQVLAALARADLKATFFMLGVNAEANPRLVEQVFEAGHRIGNHSYSHPHLTDLGETEIREEIARTDRLLAPYLGADKLFRPPYGHTNPLVRKVAGELGYRHVLWTVDLRDWHKDFKPDKWMDHGVSQMTALSTCVVLLHDIQAGTGTYLGSFIERIRGIAGATFQSPSTLLAT